MPSLIHILIIGLILLALPLVPISIGLLWRYKDYNKVKVGSYVIMNGCKCMVLGKRWRYHQLFLLSVSDRHATSVGCGPGDILYYSKSTSDKGVISPISKAWFR